MTTAAIPARRRRRQPDELRREAIAAACRILVSDGPAAITLQAVAAALGMAHGSITHHFGTAANLQAAVADTLMEQLLGDVRAGTGALKAGTIDEAQLVDLVFDAFAETGIGRLIGFLAASDSPLLRPLFTRLARLSGDIVDDRQDGAAFTEAELPIIIESIVTPALSASLIGGDLLQALDLAPSFTRDRITRHLAARRARRMAAAAPPPGA